MAAWPKSNSSSARFVLSDLVGRFIEQIQCFAVAKRRKGIKAMSTLRERLEEFKKTFESGTPPYNTPREVSKLCIAPQPNSKRRGLKMAR